MPSASRMHTTPEQLRTASERLGRTLAHASPEDFAAPSLLPGWSRAHVVSHLVRNADGMHNLLRWARSGDRTPMYPSPERRASDIEEGAWADPGRLAEEFHRSARELLEDLSGLSERERRSRVELPNGRALDAGELVWHRLKEVEIHHADLSLGYAFDDWETGFALDAMEDVLDFWSGLEEAPSLELAPAEGGPALRSGGGATRWRGRSAQLLARLAGRPGAEVTQEGPDVTLLPL